MKAIDYHKVDLDRVIQQILKGLRGRMSQTGLSRALGFDFNQVHRWEKGAPQISWTDYLKFAEKCGIRVSEELRREFSYQGSAWDLPCFLRYIMGRRDISSAANEAGLSRFSLSRWLHEESEPKLRDILQLVRSLTSYFPWMVSVLAGGKPIPEFSEQISVREIVRQTFARKPWLILVYVALEDSRYKKRAAHDPEVLADILGIEIKIIEESLSDLKRLSIIKKAKGRWAVAAESTHLELGPHWNAQFAEYYRRTYSLPLGDPKYEILSCSAASMKKIQEAYVKVCYEVQTLLAEEDVNDDTELALLHFSQVFLHEISNENLFRHEARVRGVNSMDIDA